MARAVADTPYQARMFCQEEPANTMTENAKFPDLGQSLPACHESPDTLALLRARRSCPADFMEGPGPDAKTLEDILTIAARVPDHRRVVPFRFMVFEGDARAAFGAVLRRAFMDQNPGAEAAKADFEANRFLRAPVVVAVVSSLNKAHKTPAWEQTLTSGAVCQNMLIAASAHGYAAQWLTEWYAYDAAIDASLGLGEDERIAGFVYIGTAKEDPKERGRPDMPAIIARYNG